jgi:hypothetical protein
VSAWVPQPDWESFPEYRWVPSRVDEHDCNDAAHHQDLVIAETGDLDRRDLGDPGAQGLGWLVGIHALFLGSLLTVVLADRLSAPIQHPSERRSGTTSR